MTGLYSDKVMEHFRNPKNMGEIKDADGVGTVGNPVCLTPENLINTTNGVEVIKKLRENDFVLTHDGTYNPIKKVYKTKYNGKVYSIEVHNLGKTTCTPEHHILALKIAKISHKFKAYKDYPIAWYEAGELEKGDVLLYPIPTETRDIKQISFDIEKPRLDFKSKKLPDVISVNDDFLRLIGYYLSEGYVRTDPCKGEVGFVFGSKEGDYVEDVVSLMKKTFHITPSDIVKRHNSINIKFYSARLARFFEKMFGKGASNKHLPDWALTLPIEKQRHIICGLWRGDGYIRDGTSKYVTISKQLSHQLRILLLRQKIIFSYLVVPKRGVHRENYHIYVKDDLSLKKLADIVGVEINTPKNKKRNHHKSWFDGDYYYVPIKKIVTSYYNGFVYNLNVDNTHSFVSCSSALHNCGDLMTIYIKVKDNKIHDIKFKTFGCAAAIATSSMITELAKGKTLEEAMRITRRDVAESLDGLPPQKLHCSNLAADALQAAIKDYYEKHKKKS